MPHLLTLLAALRASGVLLACFQPKSLRLCSQLPGQDMVQPTRLLARSCILDLLIRICQAPAEGPETEQRVNETNVLALMSVSKQRTKSSITATAGPERFWEESAGSWPPF